MLTLLWRSSWRIFITVIFIGAISGLVSAGLVEQVNNGLSESLFDSGINDFAQLKHFLGLAAAVLISGFFSRFFSIRLGEKTTCELRVYISRLILNASYPNLQKLGKSNLLANLTEDISKISNAFLILPEICVNGAMLIGCVAYLAWMSWPLALITSAIIFFGVLIYLLMANKPKKLLKQAREDYDYLNRDFRHLIDGIKELKLHDKRSIDFMSNSLMKSAESYRLNSVKANTYYMLGYEWSILLFYLVIGLTLFVLPYHGINKEIINGYLLAFLFMMGPLSMLTESLSDIAHLKVATEEIQRLDSALKQQDMQQTTSPLLNDASEFISISLQNVTHYFHREKENREFKLGPINVDFKSGELVFLAGGNGSGKTTLAMIIIGLYTPEMGVIKFNNTEITDMNRDAYLQQFSVVFSDFHLFETLFGFNSSAIEAEANSLLKKLHLNHKVKVENGRFSTVNLSQGQRKRLALLIAYLEDRPIYVFDEWAADQDPEFKDLFYRELLPALKAKGKTVLAITHDGRYFHLADRCIKIDEGQIYSTQHYDADTH